MAVCFRGISFMRLNHVDMIDSDFALLKDVTVRVENGRISAIGKDFLSVPADEEEYDLSGLILFPGFIDLHIHGAKGKDTSDGTIDALSSISAFLASCGVTSFCPTTMMIPREKLIDVLASYEHVSREPVNGAKLLGVRLEGPFLSREKCGVQNTDYAMLPSEDFLSALVADFSPSDIAIIDISPELPGAMEFIRSMKEHYVLSCAHTAASYSCCKEAIREGLSHGTHLFNAMDPLGHHEPGAVGALLTDPAVTCELICDGLHVHPSVLHIAFTVLGEDRAVVCSDAMRAAGMPDGEYDLGGKMVTVRSGRTDMGNGRLAGSTTNLHDEFLNLLKLGIPLRTALKACTLNPAKVIRADQDRGSLQVGKYADMVAMDAQYNVKKVFVEGRLVFDSDQAKGADEI